MTGAGSGIGRETALRLGREGARVGAADLDGDAAAAVADEIGRAGGDATAFRLDVASADAVRDLADTSRAVLGDVDILVNMAGVFHVAPIEEIGDDDWARMIGVHLTGTFLMCRAFVPAMAARGFGAVVNTASIFALRGQAEATSYAAAKGGIIGFSKALAREKAADGVRVNVVAPGPVDTPFFRGAFEDADIEAVMSDRAQIIPMGRIGDPADVAGVVAFLLGDDARHMTGQVVTVDGGELMA